MFKTDRGGGKAGANMWIPEGFGGRVYLDFLAELAAKRQTRNYLEIGVHFGHALARIPCDTAIGVDPGFILDSNVALAKRRTFLFQSTSDRFFADTDVKAVCGGSIDLAFLDGLHQFEFLLRDFYNAEAVCGSNGLILMHDCMPLNAEMTTRDSAADRSDALKAMWAGDVWKIVPILRKFRPDLDVLLLDCPPTGLVCVTGLDPASRVLSERYREIVAEFRAVPSDRAQIAAMYAANPILRSEDVLHEHDHSLYFRA